MRALNIELLRIVSMFMVLIVHANFQVTGRPDAVMIQSDEWSTFLQYFTQATSVVCVNLFVLISGWFGIHFKWKGVANILFQCIFWFVVAHALSVCMGWDTFSWKWVGSCLMLNSYNWFVKAYLLLYILAPLLNAFVENSTHKEFRMLLVSFFGFQTIFGWLFPGVISFVGGYSTISFIGLYLLARYVRLYPEKLFCLSRYKDLLIYAVFVGLITSLGYFPLFFQLPLADNLSSIQFMYCSPLVILASLYLFLFFTKLKLESQIINKIGASAFAVFLFHIGVPAFGKYVQMINDHFELPVSVGVVALYLCAIYVFCLLFDQVRIYTWNLLTKR